MTDILRICDEIDAAGEKATPRPWECVEQDPDWCHLVRAHNDFAVCNTVDEHDESPDLRFIALAANHAQDLTAVVRRLVGTLKDIKCEEPAEKDANGLCQECYRSIENGDDHWRGCAWKIRDRIYAGLEADYPSLLASPPEAGRLEGGEERG